MAQGTRVSQVCEKFPETFERIKNECQKYINIEVRFWMAGWIESNISNCQNPENFYVSFFDELTQLRNKERDVCLQNRFNETLTKVQNYYGFFRGKLYFDLCDYLRFEKDLCDQLEAGNSQQNVITVVDNRIQDILNICRKNDHDFRVLCDLYENMRICMNNLQKLNNSTNGLNHKAQVDQTKLVLTNIQTKISGFTQKIEFSMHELLQITVDVVTDVLENHLKNSQLKHIETRQLENKFDIVQRWFENVFDALGKMMYQLDVMQRFNNEFPQFNVANNGLNLMTNSRTLLDKLIYHSLVFQHQPELVVKTGTKFQSCVRLLIGKCINARMSDIRVKVQLISAEIAQGILQMGFIPSELHAGVLDNNEKALMCNESTNAYTTYFGNLMIKSRPKSEPKSTDNIKHIKSESSEGVVERKNCLLATITINYYGTVYQLYQLSSPLVVTVHNSQDIIAWATALLDSAFCNPIDPFSKVEIGSWRVLAEALNAKFVKDTSRGLTEENLAFLFWKLTSEHYQLNTDPTVTWSQFAKDKLRPVPTMADKDCFTFWEWVYANLKLIIHNAAGMWKNGYIEGFVHKSDVHFKLSACKDGTFILRFSDSVPGAITIAYVQSGIVQHVAPYNRKDLEALDLVKRLNDLDELKFIYPDIPKENINKFHSEQPRRPIHGDYIYPVHKVSLPTASGSQQFTEEMNIFQKVEQILQDSPMFDLPSPEELLNEPVYEFS